MSAIGYARRVLAQFPEVKNDDPIYDALAALVAECAKAEELFARAASVEDDDPELAWSLVAQARWVLKGGSPS